MIFKEAQKEILANNYIEFLPFQVLMSGSGHSPRHSQAVPMPIAEEGSDELRRRMSKLSNSDIEQVANAALGEVTRRNSNRYGKTSYYSKGS